MLRRLLSPVLAALALVAAGAVQAVEVGEVRIVGLDETLTENVRVSLSLAGAVGKDVPGRRFGYMMREAEDQAREALEPFGYYSPEIRIERQRVDGKVAVTVNVDPGEPVRVRNSDLAILGAGGRDRYLRQDLGAFAPAPGSVFDHALYESSKARISRRLAERGYFDADFSARRVEVTRAEHAADIELVWTSGERYDMGPIAFAQTPESIVNDELLHKLVYWDEGDYYHQGRLDRLRTSLQRLDYFGGIDIEPRPDDAGPGRRVPVDVTLTPAKRKVQTAGLSYGTDSGAGIRLGEERRYVNRRGHKALWQLDYAQRRKTLTLQYRIPAFAWLDGWYTVSLQGADEQTDYIDTRRLELVGSRSGQYNRHLNLVASIHALRERWAYIDQDDDDEPEPPPDYRYATFTYPSLRAEYIDVDDRLFPTRGIGGTVTLRSGVEGFGSDASFAQLHARGSWYRGLGERNRLIVRGEFGHTWTNALVAMPPSLVFYAGGDRSIRGYEWREVGPQRGDFAVGARNVVTGSVEFEHYFANSFGVAAFVDAGDAFDDTPDVRTGVGLGLRWRSPVGPLRFDIARGLDDPDSPFTLHLDIGTGF